MSDERQHIARRIVDRIIADLTDRTGFRQAWDHTDEDIQTEIRSTWEQIAESEQRA
jgi:hypothetical protein